MEYRDRIVFVPVEKFDESKLSEDDRAMLKTCERLGFTNAARAIRAQAGTSEQDKSIESIRQSLSDRMGVRVSTEDARAVYELRQRENKENNNG